MVDPPAGIGNGLSAVAKVCRVIKYRRTRKRLLDDALQDALDDAFTSVCDRGASANVRLAARNLLDVLNETDVPCEERVRSTWERTARWASELQSMRFPSLDQKYGAFDPRLRQWITAALLSKEGRKALSQAGLAPITEQYADRVAELTAKAFRRHIGDYDFRFKFDDKVRTSILQDLRALDPTFGRAPTPRVPPSLYGAVSGAVTVGIAEIATTLQPVDSITAGVVIGTAAALGAESLSRRKALTRPQQEVRRAVLGWLSIVLEQLYGLHPRSMTIQDVAVCFEQAAARFQVIDAFTPDTHIPERQRLHELIALSGQVNDLEVQAAMIALCSNTWGTGSQYTMFLSLRDLLRTLNS